MRFAGRKPRGIERGPARVTAGSRSVTACPSPARSLGGGLLGRRRRAARAAFGVGRWFAPGQALCEQGGEIDHVVGCRLRSCVFERRHGGGLAGFDLFADERRDGDSELVRVVVRLPGAGPVANEVRCHLQFAWFQAGSGLAFGRQFQFSDGADFVGPAQRVQDSRWSVSISGTRR